MTSPRAQRRLTDGLVFFGILRNRGQVEGLVSRTFTRPDRSQAHHVVVTGRRQFPIGRSVCHGSLAIACRNQTERQELDADVIEGLVFDVSGLELPKGGVPRLVLLLNKLQTKRVESFDEVVFGRIHDQARSECSENLVPGSGDGVRLADEFRRRDVHPFRQVRVVVHLDFELNRLVTVSKTLQRRDGSVLLRARKVGG